jgi:ParB-like chromosome segregation protein Spo0J
VRINDALRDLVVPIGSLHEDEANVRLHPERNLATIRSSLAQFGQQKPIVVLPSGKIVAGNGTWRAAKSMGATKIAAVRDFTPMPAQPQPQPELEPSGRDA